MFIFFTSQEKIRFVFLFQVLNSLPPMLFRAGATISRPGDLKHEDEEGFQAPPVPNPCQLAHVRLPKRGCLFGGSLLLSPFTTDK